MRRIKIKRLPDWLGNPEYEAIYPLAGKSSITANGRTPAEAKRRLRRILGIGK